MKYLNNSRKLQITGMMLGALIWLASNANPPNGYTGAPFNSTCGSTQCHGTTNTNGYDGTVELSGLPGTIEAGTVYPLTITVTPTAGTPVKAGFQLVAVAGNNTNAGDLASVNTQTGTEMLAGREYIEHRNGKVFGGGSVSWDFNWTAPVTASGNIITFYYIANFTNGDGTKAGDFPIAFNTTYPFNGPPPLSATITTTNPLCNGASTGSATVEATGGIPPYTYIWTGGQTTQTAINLPAGTYTVTVTATGGGGTTTATTTITQPPVISLTATSSGTITCVNLTATATATASGGTPPYTFAWSNGVTGNPITVSAPGAYTVTMTDNNGCTKIATATVSGNTTPPVAAASSPGNLSCTQTSLVLSGAGSSTGASFSYLWTTVNGNIVSGATTLSPTINAAGAYTIKVTNSTNGCIATASVTVTSTALPPGANATAGTLTCTNSSTTVNATSGTSGVNYSWTGPNNFTSNLQNPTVNVAGQYTVVVTNPANGCTSSASANVVADTNPPTASSSAGPTITCTSPNSQVFGNSTTPGVSYSWAGPNSFTSSLQNPGVNVGGVYTVSVTGTNGCVASSSTALTQNTVPPGAGATGGIITCANTSVTLTATTSGVQPTFSWSGPGGNSSQQNFTVSVAGAYQLAVTDGINGCVSTASAAVTSNTTPPVASATVPNNLNCLNATVQINGTASSQGPNFVYAWTTTNGNFVSGSNTLTPVVDMPGTYTLTVNNSVNGCTSTTSVTVNQTPPVVATITGTTSVSCNGGTNGAATSGASGGNGTYTYAWSTGATTSAVSNLSAGTYALIITDGENCTASVSATITQPDLLVAGASATGETSAGASDGTATAAPSGGTSPWSYAWSSGGTTATISGLAPGNYTVSVTDTNACSAIQTVTVNSFNCNLAPSISSINVSCNGANNGIAWASVSGHTNPVAYTWNNGATNDTITGLAPGSYTVQILDANNCPAALNVSITEPASLSANATATGETSVGAQNGTATAQPTGGTGAYLFVWSNGDSIAALTNLAPGTYTVSVTDANNCTAIQSVIVNSFNCAVSTSVTTVNVSCAGGSNGQATVTLNGGIQPYTYAWSNGANTATAINLVAGTYTASVTDGAACLASQTITILEPAPLATSVSNVLNVLCPEDQTGSAQVSASGGTQPYQISWPGGSNGQNLAAGNYAVSVSDGNGCIAVQPVAIVSSDSIAPTLACPGNIALCGADIVNYPTPLAADNCSLAGATPVLTGGLPSGSAFDDGVTIQTYRVTDASGNTGTCSFTVTVNPLPDVTVDGFEDETDGGSNGSIKVTPLGNTGPFIFAWSKNGEFFSNEEDITGIAAGVYSLVVIDANGCTAALSPIMIGNLVGTQAPGKIVSIRLLPNPAYTDFRVDMVGAQALEAQIMDPRGQLVQDIQAADLTRSVPVDHLPTGMYFLRILTDEGRWMVLKWIKAE